MHVLNRVDNGAARGRAVPGPPRRNQHRGKTELQGIILIAVAPASSSFSDPHVCRSCGAPRPISLALRPSALAVHRRIDTACCRENCPGKDNSSVYRGPVPVGWRIQWLDLNARSVSNAAGRPESRLVNRCTRVPEPL